MKLRCFENGNPNLLYVDDIATWDGSGDPLLTSNKFHYFQTDVCITSLPYIHSVECIARDIIRNQDARMMLKLALLYIDLQTQKRFKFPITVRKNALCSGFGRMYIAYKYFPDTKVDVVYQSTVPNNLFEHKTSIFEIANHVVQQDYWINQAHDDKIFRILFHDGFIAVFDFDTQALIGNRTETSSVADLDYSPRFVEIKNKIRNHLLVDWTESNRQERFDRILLDTVDYLLQNNLQYRW